MNKGGFMKLNSRLYVNTHIKKAFLLTFLI